MLRPEYLFLWILFHLAAVELPKGIAKRGQPPMKATELVERMQYQEAIAEYSTLKKVKSANEMRSLAIAFSKLGYTDTAMSIYKQMVKKYPSKVTPSDKLNMALLLNKMGEKEAFSGALIELKTVDYVGLPILNQENPELFLLQSKPLESQLSVPQVQKIESNNACFLPVKDPVAGSWCFHERVRVNGGLLSTVSSADGQPYAKVMKANNWASDTLSAKGVLLEKQLLNKHFELTFIDSFGNMYVTTNHSLVNDSDDYLLDVFKYAFNPKVGDYTLKSLHFDKWNSNLAGFVMNQSQTKGLFYCDMVGGFGKSDIYMCDIVWSDDKSPTLINYFNLGGQVNTILSDIDPVFITDEIIAFSTEGHIGWGGSDIYFFNTMNNRLVNAGRLINSQANEFAPKFYDGVLYFSTDRYGNKSKIMKVELSMDLLDRVMVPENYIVETTFPEENTESSLPEELIDVRDETKISNLIQTMAVAEPEKYNYAKGLNFLMLSDSVRLEKARKIDSASNYQDYQFITLLHPVGDIVVDANFENELLILTEVLKRRSDWKVQVRSHTDSKGSKKANRKLSQERADFLKVYLVSQGVPSNQVEAIGYGEELLLNHCIDGAPCSEDEHRRNRRTELLLQLK
ncbi:MAG: OmpA family protein [Bacteroidia bacterium]|nr:OmpA family protein [Bacteroidia bacterium]